MEHTYSNNIYKYSFFASQTPAVNKLSQHAQEAFCSVSLLSAFCTITGRIPNGSEIFKIVPGPYYEDSFSYALPDHCCLNLIPFLLSSLEMRNNWAVTSLFILFLKLVRLYFSSLNSRLLSVLKFLSLVIFYEIFSYLDFSPYILL